MLLCYNGVMRGKGIIDQFSPRIFHLFEYRKSSLKSPGDLFIFAYLEGNLKERGLLERGDLLIIQGKKCYKNVLMHFSAMEKLC